MVDENMLEDIASEQESYQDERIARLIRLAARSFNRSLQMRLTTEGMTFGQWIFLRILWEHDGLSQRALSEKAHLTEPTTHTALSRMEDLGLIERRKVGSNKRRQHAFLTRKGRELRDRLEPLAIETNDLALAGLSNEEVRVLRHALDVVIRNLEQDEVESASRGVRVPSTRSLQQI
ncbi:DNA-binding transcriptional regulator, MarR family [Sulfitobacter brevis]|uniref:DNA-binding transcriptional regulator, MarR family n=1 Tax=Sulfitobacter brevis TaxID=74348 RepID=A0A1I2FAX3_9RHOB|nr:MarR family transcriptional regulator [Sulfitobacter brevis]SFF02624.1 DNA-binding transcriptional regulator, MarR family [Sulfitobacter brevis]